MQAAGRTARMGKKGTAQLIICENNFSNMEQLKSLRNKKEA